MLFVWRDCCNSNWHDLMDFILRKWGLVVLLSIPIICFKILQVTQYWYSTTVIHVSSTFVFYMFKSEDLAPIFLRLTFKSHRNEQYILTQFASVQCGMNWKFQKFSSALNISFYSKNLKIKMLEWIIIRGMVYKLVFLVNMFVFFL